ncbi:MAG: hypothetical protein HY369_01525 [Candidatus Aenigmarchaeota archaeon]|nr:hypothetical protein [Candidatus Aenigmarchaeota archaeon]
MFLSGLFSWFATFFAILLFLGGRMCLRAASRAHEGEETVSEQITPLLSSVVCFTFSVHLFVWVVLPHVWAHTLSLLSP